MEDVNQGLGTRDGKIMKILIVSCGSAELRTTWSGVPNRIVGELRRRGINVECVDYDRVVWTRMLRILFNRVIRKIVKSWGWRMFCSTKIGVWAYSFWLKSFVKNKQYDLIIAMAFWFNAKAIKCPMILIHDWTNSYLHSLFQRRDVFPDEVVLDGPVFKAMRSANKVVSLYPKSTEYMKEHIGNNVYFYGNPVNIEGDVNVIESINGGIKSKHILLVGGATYQPNVEAVIQAVNLLEDRNIVVDVVGRTRAETKPKHCTVNFYGYLNQDKVEDKDIYEQLYRKARCFVNIHKGWCGGSSVAEALYRGVPVIVSNHKEIVELYGDGKSIIGKQKWGYFCEAGNIEMLAEQLKELLAVSNEIYSDMGNAAHAITANDTYDNFISKLLS